MGEGGERVAGDKWTDGLCTAISTAAAAGTQPVMHFADFYEVERLRYHRSGEIAARIKRNATRTGINSTTPSCKVCENTNRLNEQISN